MVHCLFPHYLCLLHVLHNYINSSFWSFFLSTCPNHLCLAPSFSVCCLPYHIPFFLSSHSSSITVIPTILLSILISVLATNSSVLLPISQHSAPYRRTGLIIVLYSLEFSFLGIFLSYITPVISLHLYHVAFILCLTAVITPPFLTITIPKYFNSSTCYSSLTLISTIFIIVLPIPC